MTVPEHRTHEGLRLMVGSWGHAGFVPYNGRERASDFTSAADGICTYRWDDGSFRTAQPWVDSRIRVGGSLVDAGHRLIHVSDEVTANTTLFPASLGAGGGNTATYAIDDDGALHQVALQSAYGANPTTLCLAAGGRFVVHSDFGRGRGGGGPSTTAAFDEHGHLFPRINHTEQSLVCRRRNDDGTIGEVTDVFVFNAGMPASGLQSVAVDPFEGTTIIATEKSRGELHLLRLDPDRGRFGLLHTLDEREASGIPGFAGRSVVFHPHRPLAYVDSGSTPHVLTVRYTADRLEPVGVAHVLGDEEESILAAVADRGGKFEQEDLVLSADGAHLYVVMLGAAAYDSVLARCAVFDTDAETGLLTLRQSLDLPGAIYPRGADLSPDGDLLAIACVFSHEVLILSVAPDGTLALQQRIEQDSAAHPRFYRAYSA